MLDGFLALRRTEQATGTACNRFSICTRYQRTAHRAGCRHVKLFRTLVALLFYHTHDFRNDITGTAYNDAITATHILALNLVCIMQGGIGHRDTTDKHRFQPRYRRQRTGAPHLDINAQHRGLAFLCRKFSCNGPARRTRYKTQLILLLEPVNLEDDTIYFKRQLLTQLLIALIIGSTALRTGDRLYIIVNSQMPVL